LHQLEQKRSGQQMEQDIALKIKDQAIAQLRLVRDCGYLSQGDFRDITGMIDKRFGIKIREKIPISPGEDMMYINDFPGVNIIEDEGNNSGNKEE
jgi:hypothetical protein